MQDDATLKRLSDRVKGLFAVEVRRLHLDRGARGLDVFAQPGFNVFGDAGTLIVICATPLGPFVAVDSWLAAENLMLAACADGLGTCCIGFAVPVLNAADVKAELGIPEKVQAFAPMIVGVPRGETAMTSRKAPVVLRWIR